MDIKSELKKRSKPLRIYLHQHYLDAFDFRFQRRWYYALENGSIEPFDWEERYTSYSCLLPMKLFWNYVNGENIEFVQKYIEQHKNKLV